MRILLDTNLVVGLWLGDSKLGVLRLALADGSLPIVTSECLLAESREVLMRPAVRRDRGYSHEEVEAFLLWCFGRATRCVDAPTAPGMPLAPDPGDQFLWNLLMAEADLQLWTRDKRLLRDRAMRGRVRRPPGDGVG